MSKQPIFIKIYTDIFDKISTMNIKKYSSRMTNVPYVY